MSERQPMAGAITGITIQAPLELRLRSMQDKELGPIVRAEIWRTDDETMVTYVRMQPDDVRRLISVSRYMLKAIERKRPWWQWWAPKADATLSETERT